MQGRKVAPVVRMQFFDLTISCLYSYKTIGFKPPQKMINQQPTLNWSGVYKNESNQRRRDVFGGIV